jgi:beta-N-acetylglucosaminidase
VCFFTYKGDDFLITKERILCTFLSAVFGLYFFCAAVWYIVPEKEDIVAQSLCELEETKMLLAEFNSSLSGVGGQLNETLSVAMGVPFKSSRSEYEPPSRSSGTPAHFDITNLTIPSGVTADELNEMAGPNRPISNYGEYFVLAEDLFGVNAVFLWSLSILEGDGGNSTIAQRTGNPFGFGAYDSNPGKYAVNFEKISGESVDSMAYGILYVAGYLSENYLNEGGKYYSGKSLSDMHRWPSGAVKYASDPQWPSKLRGIMSMFK